MYLYILLGDIIRRLEKEYGNIFISKDKGGENVRKYICILLISLILTIGANAISTSTHRTSTSDNILSRPIEICTYIGIPMAEEDDNTDDIEDDNSTKGNNSNPNPCDLVKFPEAIVDYIVVPNQNADGIYKYMSEIEYTTHDRMTIGEII